LDTLKQKITETNYNYRWNRSLPPKNHGTKLVSREQKFGYFGTKDY
jgi:hypothetical protein